MKIKPKYTYYLILIGFLLGLYAEINNAEAHQFILISGIICMSLGLFNLARALPSKNKEPDTYIQSEKNKEDDSI